METTGVVHRVVSGRGVCENRVWVASVPWNRTVNNLLRPSVTNTTKPISLDIHPYPKQQITSPLAHPTTYTSPRAPPTSSCNNHSQIPSSHLQVYNPHNAAPGPGHLQHNHSQQLPTTSLRTIRTSLFSAAFLFPSENFPASVLALDGRVDVAFHAPAACMMS
jgi:hypothetical protein